MTNSDPRSSADSCDLISEGRKIIEAYDSAMKSQKMNGNGADACLLVMANYGDLAAGILRRLIATPAQAEQLKLEWRVGAPTKPWSEEWFIAETIWGDRVVLRALPEEWTYDFKTADDTYIKHDKIKRWMQFPDSEFIAPASQPSPAATVETRQASCAPGGQPYAKAPQRCSADSVHEAAADPDAYIARANSALEAAGVPARYRRFNLDEVKSTAAALTATEPQESSTDRLRDAVQLLIDYIGDGCPDGTYGYCMSEAKAAIKGIRVVSTSPQPPSMSAADAVMSQIEERFPNWKSYRDLVDCIDCTLHALRGANR